MDHLQQLQALFECLADQKNISGLTIPVSDLTAQQVTDMGSVELNPKTKGTGLFSFVAHNGQWYLTFAGSNTVDYSSLIDNFKISLQHFIVGISDHNDRANIIKAITDKITTFRDNLPGIRIASSENIPLRKIIEYLQSKGVLTSDVVALDGKTTVFDSQPYIELLKTKRAIVRQQLLSDLLLQVDDIQAKFIKIKKDGQMPGEPKAWQEYIQPKFLPNIQHIECNITEKISSWITNERGARIECAAFCFLLYENNYFKPRQPKKSIAEFAKAKYGIDIRLQIQSKKQAERNKHKKELKKHFQ